jgi:predicted enzyme related to lactoylglutathione lyase
MSVTLLLRCNNIEETRAFYASVLGFAVASSSEETITAEKHGGKLIFTGQDLWKSGPACSGTIYFTVPDVDSCYASLKDRTAIYWPLQDMPYGSREFGITDCNGYTLAFQQQV